MQTLSDREGCCLRARSIAIAGLLATAPMSAMAAASTTADTLSQFVSNGSAKVDFRYRHEYVDQDGIDRTAHASTLRSRVTLESGAVSGFKAIAQIEDVRQFNDDFSDGVSTQTSRARHPTVSDPQGIEFNEAYLQYEYAKAWRLRYGRQRINLNDQRLVGGVAWRQNEQTFDATTLTVTAIPRTEITWALVANVNRILGDDTRAGDHRQDGTSLFNVTYAVSDKVQLAGYHLDIDNDAVAALSNRTLGIRLSGVLPAAEGMSLPFLLEIADQRDSGENPVDYAADLLRVEAGVDLTKVRFDVGYEARDGDRRRGGRDFRAPLGTLHAFNGWADSVDAFNPASGAGLVDGFAGVSAPLLGWKGRLIYHRFEQQDGGADVGDEIDGELTRSFLEHYAVALKFARFDGARAGPADVLKAWVMLSATW